MKTLLALVFVISTSYCFACLNEHNVSKSGKESVDAFNLGELDFYRQQNKPKTEKYLADLLKRNPTTDTEILWNQNSIAVCYIRLGRLQEAEAILNNLLKKYPTDYSVIINLGTLYELQGKNEKALEYINRAIAINPDSHEGSEWFHIRILEFKLKNIGDNNIAGQDILKLGSMNENSVKVAQQIRYQLQERIPFTPAPNLIMAKILLEYGDYLADSISIKGAYVMYEIGMDYDKENVLKLSERRDALKPYFKKYGEAIPITGNYYLDNVINTIDENKVEIASKLLEKGIDYFNTEAKKKAQEEKQKEWWIYGGIGLAALVAGIAIYRRKKTTPEI